MPYDKRTVTLTSGDAGATATATTTPIFGRLIKIVIHNDTTAQPSDNWDLTIHKGTASSTDYEAMFTDITISQTVTAAVVHYPAVLTSKTADGDASAITEVPPMVFGPITVLGANMGNSKVAVVELIFKVA